MTEMYKIRNHLVRQYEGLLQCEILICQKSKPLEFKTPVKSHKGWACTWMWGIFSSEINNVHSLYHNKCVKKMLKVCKHP